MSKKIIENENRTHMTNKEFNKSFAFSVLSIVLCLIGLVGTTFAWYTANATVNVSDITISAATVGDKFDYVFPNVDSYLYRVGNGNTFKLESIFIEKNNDVVIDSSKVNVSVETPVVAGNVALNKFTPNTTNWRNGTVKFTGTGVVKLTISENNSYKTDIYLEVVNGNNATTATSASSANIVLLNDVSGGLTVSNNKTLYGNGFAVNDTRSHPSGTGGFVTITNGTVDNAQLIGYQASSQVTSGTSNADYAPGVAVSGVSYIYNSKVANAKVTMIVNSGELYAYNTIFDGGAIANMEIAKGHVTLENCITTTSTSGGLKGLGIRVKGSTDTSVTLKGTFKQYNWVKQNDIPSDYRSFLNSVYNDSTYYYTYNGTKYINPGFFFDFDGSTSQALLDDQTNNSYVWKTISSYTCYAMSPGSADDSYFTSPPVFEPMNYYTLPDATFDFTNKNYIANTGDNRYCYYDTTTNTVKISFVKESADTVFEWDPMILTLEKYGYNLSYQVSMNGVNYTDKISFSDEGTYYVDYTYSDSLNFNCELQTTEVGYIRTLRLSVITVEPEQTVYHPEFTYVGIGQSNSTTKTINDAIYVMPAVSATNSSIGSTTVSGETVYFPIVTLDGKNSSGGSYSSGNIFYFAPAFSAINIVDKNKDTGATLYTYNSSTNQWPHNQPAASGADSNYFGYIGTKPYGAATGTASEVFSYNQDNGGLCYQSGTNNSAGSIQRDVNENNVLVKFFYVANDGDTYNYYIKYHYNKTTYKSSTCFTEGTMITMADGTQKAIEDVSPADRILAWDFFTGSYTASDIALLVDHGRESYEIVNLTFSDGTKLRIIGDHGLFDYDANKFVYLTAENCQRFIGRRFVQYQNENSYAIVTLTKTKVTTEKVHAYSITSAGTMNAFANGLLTVAPPEEFYNWIPMGDTLRYDTEKFNSDIEQYGLYTYSDFSDYVTYDQFVKFNGAYLKVPVEKVYFTFDY
ncbi:MAG: hypothetical protein IK085_00780, partial [Clostridia bacterium]|nr:hypothetical protein [Clostridia bacterium]